MYTAAILTISDSVFSKHRQDLSGPALRQTLTQDGFEIVATKVVPDEMEQIQATLIQLCDEAQLVVTTGGTGISHRDVTPEATMAIADKILEGLGELMRLKGSERTRFAALSRALCVTRGRSLILNLPGSLAGAKESLAAVISLIPHALDLLDGKTDHGGLNQPFG